MSNQIRLDRFLAEEGIGSRSDVKKLIRSGRVQIERNAVWQEDQNAGPEAGMTVLEAGIMNAGREVVRKSDIKIDPETDLVLVDGEPVRRMGLPTLMLNKPAGVVSATSDARLRTVIDLIHEPWADKLFPVGRLDRDTEGLLLLTGDGAMSHELLSPKKHVAKTYFAVVSGPPDPELVSRFREGLEIGEKRKTLPAELAFVTGRDRNPQDKTSISSEDWDRCGEDECCVIISITEGKFHQIKRMFSAVGREVRFLKRIAMGGLALDPTLAPGQYRALTDEELELLRNPGSENV